jgi:phage anti-repressor protein
MFRNKEFIYRARKMARFSDIKEKFTSFFSEALFFIENNNYPDSSITSGDKKCIQIRKVDPMTYVELKDFGFTEKAKDMEEIEMGKKAKDLPEKQKAYYIENFKNKFYA